MKWWEERKHLLVREKSKIDENFPANDFSFEVREGHLWLTGTLLDFFKFECRYPPSYPSALPDIFPKDRSASWIPKHQYVKEGRFCLDIREKSWSSRLTGADIIKSLRALLIAEGVRLTTKSQKLIVYEEPEPTELDRLQRNKRCVIPSDLEFPTKNSFGAMNYVYRFKANTFMIVTTSISDGQKERESSSAKKIWLRDSVSTRQKGLWVRVTEADLSNLLNFSECQQFLEFLNDREKIAAGFDLEAYFGENPYWRFLIIYDQDPSKSFLLNCNIDQKDISRFGTYFFDLKLLSDRLPNKEDYQQLNKKTVTIIGCGTGGSRDAEYLVKAGVGKIVLIDDDILKTENVLRHACQLDDLGIEKVYAVNDKLLKINPDTVITPLRKHLDVIDSTTDNAIKGSDLVVVATASNEELFNEYTFLRGIPAIYSKVYPMGFGGEVIRIIPGVTPCFECSHYYKEVLIEEQWPEKRFPEYKSVSYDENVNGTRFPLPALAVDSDFISLITVKMALEVLVAEDIKGVNSAHIRLWGNEKEWIFDTRFQCISIEKGKMQSIPNCIVCHGDGIIEQDLGKTNDQIDAEYEALMSQMKSETDEANAGDD